jgi:hypothetical protein
MPEPILIMDQDGIDAWSVPGSWMRWEGIYFGLGAAMEWARLVRNVVVG